jgi:hypothetical protein
MSTPNAQENVLYSGADLHRAAEMSRAMHGVRERTAGLRNAAGILSDVVLQRMRRRARPRLELVFATGSDPVGGDTLTAAYAGPGDNRGWCLSTVFSDYTETKRVTAEDPGHLSELLAAARSAVDVLFAEGLPPGSYEQTRSSFLRLPAWIKQRVRVLEDWPLQIDALRRETRQEVGRYLRKYEFGCSLTRRDEDFAFFHDSLYRPFVAQRFGAAAHVVERDSFLRECRRGTLLRVSGQGRILGAALLRPVGRTMAVVWSALDADRTSAELRGVTDTLDYFSLLYAHLRRCRWLDLGPSRPDLHDGILRYKGKWGAEIAAGRVPQTTISLACAGRTNAQRNFLRRHAFLARCSTGFQATMFVDGDMDPAELGAKLSTMRHPGVRGYRVVALSSPSEALREVVMNADSGAVLVDTGECADVMTVASADFAEPGR